MEVGIETGKINKKRNIVYPELLKPLSPNMPTFCFYMSSNFELAQSMRYCVHCPAPTHNS